ncbi:MAG: hypothetical protein KKC75_05285 [Nanoarchaeota archaeon]|nr:hypothetical protein [Nanoarchaeota archaeon]MBU1005745.1 hypothetical protein [Nanoarchaeota archaeon]MBU1946445.1 hypothetical protein [Nanoarchaeota archaeon]
MKKLILLLLIILLIVPSIYAKQGHLKLLAVKENDGGYEGAVADLYLEVKSGSGNVFLDTFPLTKIDTQISTRFAKDMACSYLDKDCSNYDFIYTIKANSPIIAGPSAGAAITLLTISLLDDFSLDESIGITGTINSGWIVGPVGGVKEKIDAAKQAGLKKVLIPEGERFFNEEGSVIETFDVMFPNDSKVENVSIITKTIDLVEYGKEKGLEVVEVSDIDQALYGFTGKKFGNGNYTFDIDDDYEETMSELAYQLCNRSDKLIRDIDYRYGSKQNETMIAALNLTNRSKAAILNGSYYSAASYCFGANVKFTYVLVSINNLSEKEMSDNIEIIGKNIDALEKSIDNKKKETITDLEAYAVVKERLIESEYYKELISTGNITDDDIYNLAYSSERVYSAFSWANFFDHRGKKVNMDNDMLELSCKAKIAEAEERYNYVSLFYPVLDLSGTRKEIDYAYDDMNNKSYELCLFKASQAKAESDVILSVSGIGSDNIIGLLDKKLEVAKKNVAKQIAKGNFPILAYSYYEYGTELREKDNYSALLYAEYAIELSNLDMYFKPVHKVFYFEIDTNHVLLIVLGILIGYMLSKIPRKKDKKKR